MILTELESLEKISLHFDSFIQVKCIEMRLKRDYWKNTIHDDFLFNFHISSLSPHQTMKGHGVGFFVIYKKSYCGLIAALKKTLSWKRSKVKSFQCCQNFLALFCMNYANVEPYVWCRNYPKVMEVKWANFCINVTSSFRAYSKLYFHFKVNYFLKRQDLHSYLLNKNYSDVLQML